jgi:hypothetical protein
LKETGDATFVGNEFVDMVPPLTFIVARYVVASLTLKARRSRSIAVGFIPKYDIGSGTQARKRSNPTPC